MALDRNIDFTQGPIRRGIIQFAIPVFLGNLFQQLYSTADSLIVGNILGHEALAAVSSSGSLIFMMLGFFQGVAMGAGVVISKYFGSRNFDRLEKAVHTDIAAAGICGILLSIFCVFCTPGILRLMNTPTDILPKSITYFRIYSIGIIFSVMYNACSGIMNAIGDSRHPLYYLIISSITNVVLDLLYIGVFGMGVGGAALATAMSQALSMILSFWRLTHVDSFYRVDRRKIRMHRDTLGEIVRLGLPSGIQNSVIAFANIVVQSNINTFQSNAVAGSGAYSKIEGFCFLPITCFSLAMTTFISQNLGAGNHDRARKGARFGLVCSMAMAELIGIAIFIWAPFFISLFNRNPEVIAYGTRQAHIEALFFCFLAMAHCIAGILRGAGKAKVPMFIMFGIWCVVRVLYITITLHFVHRVEVIYSAYPLTWFVSCILFVIYMLKADWIHGLDNSSKME